MAPGPPARNPPGFAHINLRGRCQFTVTEAIRSSRLRAVAPLRRINLLRNPDDARGEAGGWARVAYP
jgi:hypothetical protein